ncbi:hypothetical protein GW17_00012587 [Ensete ventricosum]|nr:hypothetical protein GW17_00012587 [Ensete ventricosum]
MPTRTDRQCSCRLSLACRPRWHTSSIITLLTCPTDDLPGIAPCRHIVLLHSSPVEHLCGASLTKHHRQIVPHHAYMLIDDPYDRQGAQICPRVCCTATGRYGTSSPDHDRGVGVDNLRANLGAEGCTRKEGSFAHGGKSNKVLQPKINNFPQNVTTDSQQLQLNQGLEVDFSMRQLPGFPIYRSTFRGVSTSLER